MTDLSGRRSALSQAKRRLLEERLRGISRATATAGEIRIRAKSDFSPLSFAQQGLWFLDQLAPNNLFYNLMGAVSLVGDLDLGALERVINEIIKRHATLRTRIEIKDGAPAQVVDEWKPRGLEIKDLTGVPANEREEEAGRIRKEEAWTGFDLSKGPLFRVKILKLDQELHTVLYTMHHVVSDGWSMEILVREVGELYQAYTHGEKSPLEELPIQYGDYAAWQQEWLQSEALKKDLEYWRARLSGMEELELPIDRPRPAVRSFRGTSRPFEIDAELTDQLRRLGQREETTIFMTLLAGFVALMKRYSGQKDAAMGTDVSGRNRPELEGLIGFFVNQLVLRVESDARARVVDLLNRVKEVCLEAYAHQDIPFEKLVEALRPERDLSRSPLFQVKFIFQNAPKKIPELGGLTFLGDSGGRVQMESEAKTVRYDLTVSLMDVGSELIGSMDYSRDLFEPETIERLTTHYIHVLRDMVKNARQPISELQFLSESEKEQIIVEWNGTQRSYPHDRCIHELFEDQAKQRPDQVALICKERQLSYGELNRRANQLAFQLHRLGAGPDVVVAICIERSVEMIVALMGTLKVGGAYLPLDPETPAERLTLMLEEAGVRVALTEQKYEPCFTGFSGRTIQLDADWERISEESDAEFPSDVEPENLAYVIYTSGSTGRPKGVMVRHKGLVNYSFEICRQLSLNSDGRGELQFATVSTITADLGNTCIFPSLIGGGRLHILTYDVATDGKRFEEYLRREPLDVLKITPSHLNALLFRRTHSFKMLPSEYLILGGEALPSELVERIRERGECRELINHYGPTETTIGSLTGRLNEGEERWRKAVNAPIGRPIANTACYALDATMNPSPIGARGELHIGGTGVARGYLKKPELTAERFIPNPFSRNGDRLYRTGDMVRRLSNGKIEFLGRTDGQVKVRGYRIELGEIESRLASHPAIKDAVALACENGSGDKSLTAFYTVNKEDGQRPIVDHQALRGHLLAALPEYMTPLNYIELESLPLTPNGKLDRLALTAQAGPAKNAREYEAPVGEIEVGLATLWAEALNLERVGRNDNFFALGGHSLLAVILIERMRVEGYHADVQEFFASPTLAALAAGLGRESKLIDVPPNRIPPGCAAISPEMLPLAKLSVTEIERIVRRTPGGAANVQDIYPLAPLQEGILFHYLLETEGDPYLGRGLFRFDSFQRLKEFLRALQSVIDRHDILRTAVHWDGLSEPAQVVLRQASLVVNEIHPDPATGEIADQLYAHIDPRRFRLDISQAPMLQAYIARDAAGDAWVMALLYHHLSIDHFAVEILLEEIQANLMGRADQLPAPLPFRNFVAQALYGVSREEHEAFFRTMLSDVDAPTAPYGLIDARGDGSDVRKAHLDVTAELFSRLQQIARTYGVSAASLYHLAWAQVLAKISGKEDVVFGTVLFGRMQGGAGVDRVVGLFINTLPLRIKVGERAVKACVERTHALLTQLLKHEHAPLALAQRCSGVAAPTPLFSSFLNYRYSKRGEVSTDVGAPKSPVFAGIEFLGNEQQHNYPLSLSIDDFGDGFSLGIKAQWPIDPIRLCHYMHAAVDQLISSLTQAPETSIHSLNILPELERRQVLFEWSLVETALPRDLCIHELFSQQAQRTPDRIALIDERRRISYGELNRRANQIGNYLRSIGAGPEAVVGICFDRSVEMAVALMGALKAGAAYLPLDPEIPPERLSLMLNDAGAKVALIHSVYNEKFSQFWTRTQSLDEDWEKIAAYSADPPQPGVGAENLAYVIYTSGSTGRPKGVMVRHRSLVNYSNWVCRRLAIETEENPGLQFATVSTIAADLGNTCIFPSLTSGGSLHILSYETATDGMRYEDYLKREPIDALKIVPSHLEVLLGAQLESANLLPFRYLILGGEKSPYEMIDRIKKSGRGCVVINHYGPTETTIGSLTDTVDRIQKKDRESAIAPIGRPISNTYSYILDHRLQPTPIGARGQLYIGGEGVARGYLGRPDLTAERFIPNPYSLIRGDRFYHSGDVCRHLPDGKVEYIGRADRQVKIRGFRIELGEIEAVLNAHPAVKQCAVIIREDEHGETRLIGYAVADMDAITLDLKRHIRQSLPAYMTPEAIVVLEEMPITSNGKIDRKRLPVVQSALRPSEEKFIAPRTPSEEILVGIFEEILNLRKVGIHDNFFEIGGHSLLATRVISRVRSTFEVEIGIKKIFEAPTAANLAEVLDTALAGDDFERSPKISKRDPSISVPLSFAQQRLWFIDQLDPGNAAYNCSRSVRLEGRLDLKTLESVINEIVRRHESLRTRFEIRDGKPVQIIDEWIKRRLEIEDLTGQSEGEREEQAAQIARKDADTGFDLSRGPLFKVKILKLDEERHIAIFTAHHIVSDGWSMGVLVREVYALYEALREGGSSPLPDLEIQYGDYAVWQRSWLQGETLERQLGYWMRQLEGAPRTLNLPTDHPRPPVQTYRGGRRSLSLSADLATKLRDFSRSQKATMFMTLLAGFQALLYRYTWQEDIVIGAGIANRNRIETEPLIGFFINMLALRTNFSGDPTFIELAAQAREVSLGAYAHQEVPFDLLVEKLQPKRDLSRTPLFQVVFVLQNTPLEPLELPGINVIPLENESNNTHFDLMLSMGETSQGLIGVLEYNLDLFEPSTVDRMLKTYALLLEAMVFNPDRRILDAPLPTEESRQLVSDLQQPNIASNNNLEAETFHF
jgi:amino acid adenylation domain-containing protein